MNLIFGETHARQCVHRIALEHIVTKLMVSVHRDAQQDGLEILVMEYAAQDVKMVHVISRVGSV